ncbi:hypothetical protein QFC20_005200 [Naganishia adeliensis]|uniref:Uncharacterized protein n=1 Tax=Naganishia adeliensis TaxID=92952 RepID=A0ACC2VS03_9TREE|nr:hypothetical protein QFC20_005200 [Naganishia adeliensis]
MSNNSGVIKDIPPEAAKSLEASLVSLVDGSQSRGGHADQEVPAVAHADAIHTTGHNKSRGWISKFWPSEAIVDKLTGEYIQLFAYEHMEGKLYDKEGPEVLPHIQSFIQTLKASARPIDAQDDPRTVVSPADCRMTVFENVDQARKFWIKGRQFSIPELLGHDERFEALQKDAGCMLCIARLAPQDYHRFHSPVDGVVQYVKDIDGELYTVNPQAVNEDLNVFTKNRRSVMLLHANLGPGREQTPVALVAIGGKSISHYPSL